MADTESIALIWHLFINILDLSVIAVHFCVLLVYTLLLNKNTSKYMVITLYTPIYYFVSK